MSGLPSGTVTLLFSDVEGSTVLLSRLGPAYTEALDGQRRVLRRAWAAHDGTELGTEGDSFFVVFATAEDAVAAAVQAQRELAEYPWPEGVRVRVRMGIHSGSPRVHDGGYVGMDVHRAARISNAAHGGQLVVSSATAGLVSGCLPSGARLRDLGSHRLKDIAMPEHLFQVTIDGLPTDFPPLRTLGAVSTLPVAATPLVGRDGELADLSALLGVSGTQLVTLTGPGGSGKTRLAIGLAQRLTDKFPDGVFFIPLAAVTTAEVMWTSIGEVLDLPPEGRSPPRLLTEVAHRRALFVLDNLEQLPEGDQVVAQLLAGAPGVVVIATSRRPLSVPAEHLHPVPPLDLPEESTVAAAECSGAVQLFIQQARKVRPSFRLTAANLAEVTAICRRLDGLPLAIELAAARCKLLSPRALLSRLDHALDIAAAGRQAPRRQRTLRDTVTWSHDLLPGNQQVLFRRLGVFAGGADLDAVAAVTADILGDADPLDLVADLVDASLATIGEDWEGEPRIGMLVTIRAFALDQLRSADELGEVGRRHALHYLAVARRLHVDVEAGSRNRVLEANRRFGLELDNFREALSWALPSGDTGPASPEQMRVGLELCAELSYSWQHGGYFAEARRWLERGLGLAAGDDNRERGRCLSWLAAFRGWQGDHADAREAATESVSVWRRLDDERGLATALLLLAGAEWSLGDFQAGRRLLDEALTLARGADSKPLIAWALSDLAKLEFIDHNLERQRELQQAVLAIHRETGDDRAALSARHDMACTLRTLGRLDEARREMQELIPLVLELGSSDNRTCLAEDLAALLADLGQPERAARLIGAADAMRDRDGTRRNNLQDAELRQPFADARAALPPAVWDHEYQHGRAISVEEALTEAHVASTGLG